MNMSAQTSTAEAPESIRPRSKPPHHVPFTPEQLLRRAVARRDHRRALQTMILASGDVVGAETLFDGKAPHANRGTRPRRHHQRMDAKAKDALKRALLKEAEIGIDPVYRIHGSNVPALRDSAVHKAWKAAGRAWDRLHPLPIN